MPTWIWAACIKVVHSSSIVLKKLPASGSSTSSISSWASLLVAKVSKIQSSTQPSDSASYEAHSFLRHLGLVLENWGIQESFYIIVLSCIYLSAKSSKNHVLCHVYTGQDLLHVDARDWSMFNPQSHPWALHSQHSEVAIIVVFVNGYRPWEFSWLRRWNWHESTPHIITSLDRPLERCWKDILCCSAMKKNERDCQSQKQPRQWWQCGCNIPQQATQSVVP